MRNNNFIKFITNNKIINNIIILNSVIIFILLFNNLPSYLYNILFFIDFCLNVYFSIEIICNVFLQKKNFFKKITNIIDILLLITVIYLLCIGDFQQANSIYAIRFLRLIKCIKLFKLIPNYNKILKSIKIVCNTCLSIFLIFLIIIFVMSMLLTLLFSNVSPEYFGNPFISIYTVFRLLTIEGWYDIPNNISNNYNILISFIIKFIFCLIVIIGIFSMPFITSLVTDELASDNNDEVLKKLKDIEEKINKINKN